MLQRGEVGVTVENVEVRKEDARFEWTDPRRCSVSATQPRREEFHTRCAARPGARLGRCVSQGWHYCQEGNALPCRDGLLTCFAVVDAAVGEVGRVAEELKAC